jgi:hypothetical protein
LPRRQKKQQGLSTQRRGQLGVNVVERIVLSEWRSRWQQIDAQNDDGVDGLIFLEAGGRATGQIVFAQIKCHQSSIGSDGKVRVNIGREKLKKSVERWRKVVGAAILIHVDPETQVARWVNLRDPKSMGPTQIFVPKDNLFDISAKRTIKALCGAIHRDMLLPHIHTEASDFPHVKQTQPISKAALKLYNRFKVEPVYLGNGGKVVRFSALGWRHITRPLRSRLLRYQSLLLLGVVRKMLATTEEGALTPFVTDTSTNSLVAARAAISFPFRQTAVIKIVLSVRTVNTASVYSFHTIYEYRRRRDILGGRPAKTSS